MKNVIVIFGGVSPEHDVSVITGCLVANSVDTEKFNVFPVYVDSDGRWYEGEKFKKLGFYRNPVFKKKDEVFLLPPSNALYRKTGMKKLANIAVCINCMHGGNGENGVIGGLMELCGIALASPTVLGASLSMDKSFTKTVMKGLGVKTVDYVTALKSDFYRDRIKLMQKVGDSLNFPVIVKPARTGSSIGISVAKDFEDLETALEKAFDFDVKVLCEKFLSSPTEINCAAYKSDSGITVSECEKPVTLNEILTFDDKYCGSKTGESMREFPAKIPKKISDEIKEITKEVYLATEQSGVVRIDYLIKDGEVYLNEINAVPGSMAYYLFCNKISEFTGLLTDLLNFALKKQAEKSVLINKFDSSVLALDGVNIKK